MIKKGNSGILVIDVGISDPKNRILTKYVIISNFLFYSFNFLFGGVKKKMGVKY